MSTTRQLIYVYAEYCPGDFFWGWWLYKVPIEEGKADRRNGEYGNYHWLHYDWLLTRLMETLGLPTYLDYRGANHAKYTDAFLEKYPNGVILWEVSENGGLEEFELPTEQLEIQAWQCLKAVRESQLLDWKNSDESYLGKRERKMEAA